MFRYSIFFASSTNFFSPFSVRGCASIAFIAESGAVTTSAPRSAHPVMWATLRMEAPRILVPMP